MQAFVERQKITAYLLSEENSGGKSAFFVTFGFDLAHPEKLEQALLAHAAAHEVARVLESVHGRKYIIDGKMHTPDGRSALIRSVWIVEHGKAVPRLVTAYPLEGENG